MKTRDLPLIETFCKRAVLLTLCAGALSLRAQTSTWDGGSATTDDWTDADNWGGSAPSTGDVLEFDGVTRLAPNNDFTAGTDFGGLSFLAGADPFVLSGNAINLSGNVDSAALGTQTVNLDIALTNSIGINISSGSASSQITFGGNISGAHGLTLSGSDSNGNNRINLSGTNSYTGTTTVGTAGNRVTAWVTNPDSLPGDVSVVDGSTVLLSGIGNFSNNINIEGNGARSLSYETWLPTNGAGALVLNGGAEVSGTVTLTGNSRISGNPSYDGGTISGQITGDYDLQFGIYQRQPGEITLTNPANDWTGDTYVTGARLNHWSRNFDLRLGADNVLPYGANAGDVYIGTDGTYVETQGNEVNINGLNYFVGSHYGTIRGGGSFTLGHNDANGDYRGTMAVDALTKVGAGTQSMSGTTTATASTTVSGGTLRIYGGVLNGGAISVADGATLEIDGAELRYTHATAMDLNSTGTFAFTRGTLTGTNWEGGLSGLTIGSDHTLAPGTSPGAATTGSQTWTGGGTFQFEVNDAEGSSGTNWDHLTVTGDLDISGLSSANPFIIDVVSLDGTSAGEALNFNTNSAYEWEFVSFANLIGTFSSDLFQVDTTNFQNAFTQDFEVNRIGDTLVVSVIPEPSTLALLVISLGVGLFLRRKQRS